MTVLEELRRLHAEVDVEVRRLGDRLGGGLQLASLRCGPGCVACCEDSLTVFEVEAEAIRRAHAELLRSGIPAPPGRCAFLDRTDRCRIYATRPYVCRTQGLPLRWLEEVDEGELVERRDICPVNEECVELLELPEDGCWTIGPVEGRLASLEARRSGGPLRRVALRSLFGMG